LTSNTNQVKQNKENEKQETKSIFLGHCSKFFGPNAKVIENPLFRSFEMEFGKFWHSNSKYSLQTNTVSKGWAVATKVAQRARIS